MHSDSSTIQRNARRASYGTNAPAARRASSGVSASTSASAGSPNSPYGGSSTIAVGPRNEESYGIDTWTSFLYQQWYVQQAAAKCTSADEGERQEAMAKAAKLARTCSPPLIGTLRRADMLATLQTLIAQQNNEVVTTRQETLSCRRAELPHHSPSPPRSTPAEGASASPAEAQDEQTQSTANANGHTTDRGNTQAACLERTLTVSVLASLLEPCREQWQAKLSSCIAAPSTSGAKAAALSLPSAQVLLDCVLDGLATDATRRYIAIDLLGVEASELTTGIDPQGLFTHFEAPVQALTTTYRSFVPSLTQLRERYFAALDPSRCSAVYTDSFLDSTLEVLEGQLDTLLRSGSSVEALSSLLLEGVHPSLRRLVYARALQLSLSVTDGQPLFSANGSDLLVNTPAPEVASFLSCGTKYARDKVRRRCHHYYSSATQKAFVERLQAAVAADNASTVGNDERYFVFEEETAVLGAALVADKSVPDVKLKTALQQLGYDEEAFEAYITFLEQKDGDATVHKAPPCGFVPLAGFSLLIAPLAYVTGDTTEQYELASAMCAQLWSRLHGPTPEFLQCCWLFEYLVASLAPKATLHAARVLRHPALRLAVEWMTTGFVDLLEPSELLLLWDVVLAFHVREVLARSPLARAVGLADVEGLSRPDGSDDTPTAAACGLWVLPLFAAALFVWRAPLIEACHTAEELRELFVAGHNIRARAVLQQLLFLLHD